MKRLATLAFAAILTCGICESAFAQTGTMHRHRSGLTDQEIKDLDLVARTKVFNLTNLIKKIANKRYTNREEFIKEARMDFINYCLPYFYEVKDASGKVLKRDKNLGVKMELATATKHGYTTYERLMRVYFYNLMKFNYKTVKITNTDIADMKTTKPKLHDYDKDGNEIYKCVVVYVQRFEGQTHDDRDFGEDTTKVVEVYIKKIEILDNNNEPTNSFSVKLGDILVDKLEKIDPSKNIELIPEEDILYY